MYEFIAAQEDKVLVARINLLGQLGLTRLDGGRVVAAQQVAQTHLQIVAKSDEQSVNQQWENAEATWDLDLFPYGSNVLASLSGGVQDAKDKSQTGFSRAMSAGLAGASAGIATSSPTVGVIVAGLSFFAG